MSAKKFDAVEMKRQGARRIHQRTKNMTPAEEVEYWQKRSQEFRREPVRNSRPAKSKRKAS